jgi:predicted phage-related endonuclease
MKTLNVEQGSNEWLEVRARYRAASDAPVVMGVGRISRDELLRLKATGDDREFSDYVRRHILDRGHEIEAVARPIAEALIGEELYPVTGVCDDGYLLASFDGLTMGGDICWECKSWNRDKVESVMAGRVPEADHWQVVQQLVVSGAEHCLYMVTDGTVEQTATVMVRLDPADAEKLRDYWRQFDADLAAYVPAPVAPEPVGRAPEDLPALRVEVTGMVTASNLEAFRDHALAVFDGINTELACDEDFADAERTVKWRGEVEQRLEAAKEQALAQTADIDALFRALDEIKAEARDKRLELDKLVKARKQSIRAEIVNEAREALAAHVTALEETLPGAWSLPLAAPDFAAAMKGKRTISSLRGAVDAVLTDAKVEASRLARRMADNLEAFAAFEVAHGTLFPDLGALLNKEAEDFLAVVKLRIAEHKAALEEARRTAEAAPAPEPEPAPASRPAKGVVRRQPPSWEQILRAIAHAYDVNLLTAERYVLDAMPRKEVA